MAPLLSRFYALTPEPRTRTKPLQVMCLGMPRSGTDSLSKALAILGYDHVYHGFDKIDLPWEAEMWCHLLERKYYGAEDGECDLTVADFEPLLGHCEALTDMECAGLSAELIKAYPNAKVVLNYRRDEDAWYRSLLRVWRDRPVGRVKELMMQLMLLFSAEPWWISYLSDMLMVPLFGGNLFRNAKWARREHHAMVRGLVEKERLLEWSVEDGWEPLCEFLDKPVPNKPFPKGNTPEQLQERIAPQVKKWTRRMLRNFALTLSVAVGTGGIAWKVSQGNRR